MNRNQIQLAKQQNIQTNAHYRHPRTQVWREGDYQEFFIFITPCRFGAVWIIKEQGKVKHRDVILSTTDTRTAFDSAVKAALIWIRAHHSGAKLRFRSSLERGVLFDDKKIFENGRRIAA